MEPHNQIQTIVNVAFDYFSDENGRFPDEFGLKKNFDSGLGLLY